MIDLPPIHLHFHITGDEVVAQIDDLRSALSQLSTDLNEQNAALSAAVARVEAKVAELGEPDPDLTADIQAIRDASASLDSSTSQLDALVAAPVEPPPDEPPPDFPPGE